jgi:hypothetical protein
MLFAMIGNSRTVKSAAQAAGLTRPHAFRLIFKWRAGGLIEKDSSYNKYVYTSKGELMLKDLTPLLKYIGK